MQFFVFKFISLWTYFYWHGSNTEYAVNIIFFLKKNAGDKYAQKSIHWSLVIQINFPNQRLHNKLSWTVCKWAKLDLRQRKAEGRLVLIRCETVPLPLTRVSFFWKVCVKKISNSIKRFNQITTLYLKKRVISNRNLISENIYVLEGLLNVSLTGHTSAAYLITNSNIWLFCLSFRYLSLPCLFPIVDFFFKNGDFLLKWKDQMHVPFLVVTPGTVSNAVLTRMTTEYSQVVNICVHGKAFNTWKNKIRIKTG